MKRIMILAAIIAATTLNIAKTQAKGADKTVTITILHSNDTHSCIRPLNPNLADTAIAGRGGYIRRIEMLRQERQKDPDLLLFDSGDFSQGSPFYTLFKGDVEIGLMNHMKVDATTIGNHEFDFGVDNMARLFDMASFPVLCANYRFTGTALEGKVEPYKIYKVKGVRVGVFGIDPEMEGLVDHNKIGGVEYLDPIATANEMVNTLRNREHCDVVICLSHLGWLENGMSDQEMISHTRGIDLVLGGHSHSYFRNLHYVKDLDGRSVPVDQNGKHGIYIGKIEIKVKRK